MEGGIQSPAPFANGKIAQVGHRVSLDAMQEREGSVSAMSTASEQAPSTVASASLATAPLDPNSTSAIDPPPANSPQSPSYAPLQTTILELVSISATSSAFPESFGFSVSAKGRWIVAYSSAALYIILAQRLPSVVDTCRAFRLRRKPLAVAITDIGKFAVLTSPHKIYVYHCGDGSQNTLSEANRKVQTVLLNNDARALALSSSGDMVAAASDNGIEIISLGISSGSDRRQINCGPSDAIAFSDDEKSLLVTAAARRSRISTQISISISFEDALMEEEDTEQQPIGKLWISQLLFPEKLHARQAVFLPDSSNGQVSEMLAYDSKSGRFGIFDAALKQFTGKVLGPPDDIQWSSSDRFEDTLPGVSPNGAHVATAVRLKDHSEIWTYRLPDGWRDSPSTSSSIGTEDSDSSLVPLQRLGLPQRGENTPENITCLRWLQIPDAPTERLIALVSTVTLAMPEDVVPTVAPGANGRIVLFDFKRSSDDQHGHRLPKHQVVDLDGFPLTEELADEELEMDREVDIVRRRTQVQRRQRDVNNLSASREARTRRSISSSSRNGSLGTSTPDLDSQSIRPRRRRSFSSMSDMSEDTESGVPVIGVDEPYSNSAPRSHFTLTRAATVSQNSAASRLHLRALPDRPLEYRRADGLREMPHESDADNWVPPPPPYTAQPDAPGPNAISLPITPSAERAVLQGTHLLNTSNPASRIANIPSTRGPSINHQGVNGSRGHRPPQVRSSMRRLTRQPPQVNVVASAPAVQTSLPRRRVPSGPEPLAPVPGSLNSPMTFPAITSPRSSIRHLSIPHTQLAGSQSVSAPVSPAVAYQTNMTDLNIPPPGLPNSDQLYRLHGRSNSGESAPRTAIGDARLVDSNEMMRPLPRPTPEFSGRYRTDISTHSGRRSGPVVARINTVNSVAPQTPGYGPRHDTGETPETPTGRRRWWPTGTPTRTVQESPITSQAPYHSRPLHPQVTTPSASAKPKESGSRCIVQ